MRQYPKDIEDIRELKELNAEKWMLELLKKNPDYVHWGNFEDYMSKDGSGWDSRVNVLSVDEGLWNLDEYNELVHFYFDVSRKTKDCKVCDSTGYNKDTKALDDDWYDFKSTGRKWKNKLTQMEVDALWEEERLQHEFSTKPSAEEVNALDEKTMIHDAINKWICVETRAKALGIFGNCESCSGKGYVYSKPKATVSLQLWVLHPRKGCSRGIFIENVKKDEVEKVLTHLKKARDRNNERFSKL